MLHSMQRESMRRQTLLLRHEFTTRVAAMAPAAADVPQLQQQQGEELPSDHLLSDHLEIARLRASVAARQPAHGIRSLVAKNSLVDPQPVFMLPLTRSSAVHQGMGCLVEHVALMSSTLANAMTVAQFVEVDPTAFSQVSDWKLLRRGHSRHAILRLFRICKWPFDNSNKEQGISDGTCPISQEPHAEGEEVAIWPGCQHAGSKEAFLRWACSGGACPVCRAPLPI